MGGGRQVGDHRDTKTQVCKLKVHENDMSSSLTFKFPGLSNPWKFGFNRSGDRNVGFQNLHVKEAPWSCKSKSYIFTCHKRIKYPWLELSELTPCFWLICARAPLPRGVPGPCPEGCPWSASPMLLAGPYKYYGLFWAGWDGRGP